MFDIKCKRKGCQYNKNSNCTAKTISVTEDTQCKTYKASNEKEVGTVEKIGQPPIRNNIEASCDAKCIFNKDHTCSANGITILTLEDKTCPNCCTFQPE